jgi:hypothetical protein
MNFSVSSPYVVSCRPIYSFNSILELAANEQFVQEHFCRTVADPGGAVNCAKISPSSAAYRYSEVVDSHALACSGCFSHN